MNPFTKRWNGERAFGKACNLGFIQLIGLIIGVALWSTSIDPAFAGVIYGVSDSSDSCGNGTGGSAGGSRSGGGGGVGGGGQHQGVPNIVTSTGAGAPSGGGQPNVNSIRSGGENSSSSCGSSCGAGDGSGNGNTGGSGRGCRCGMAIWEVSEPHINVWLYDEPLGYQPGLGPRVSFTLSYKQRETRTFYIGVSTNYTGVGPGWHCSWESYLYHSYSITTTTNYGDYVCDPPENTNCYYLETYTYETNYSPATVVMSDGGQRTFNADGATTEYYSHGIMAPTVVSDQSWSASTITYPDGSQEVYSTVSEMSGWVGTNQLLFLTARYDRFTNATRFYYQSASPLLQHVVDADGRTNTLSYSGSLISSVQDPFGRTATLQYNNAGVLTNIIDVAGLNSSFIYDLNGWVTNLTTPYGSTRFEYLDNGFEVDKGNVIRAVRVIDAEHGTNVYMLTQCKAWPNCSLPTINQAIVPNNFDGCRGFYECRDSMYWGSRQSVNLPLDLNQITSDDGINARMRHWLHDGGNISQTLSMEIEPSPDGQVSGQATLFDHEGKPLCYNIGPNSLPSIVARQMPDNTNWFTWYQRDSLGRPTQVVDTYSTGFGAPPLLRTNIYVYSGPDLVRHIGPNGNVEEGYAYNAQHQLTYYTNVVGDVTASTYDAIGRLTSTRTPAGLTTTNIYFSSGGDTNFVQQVIDLEIGRTNSYTWTNDLVFTHTDERGLVTTNIYDKLQRVTNVLNFLGTITYNYNRLDLVRVVDRMGFARSFGFDKVRRKIAETNALGFYTQYFYCSCGALDSIRDAAGNDTLFSYDNAGRMTKVAYPDFYAITNTYDLLGELISSTDSAGVSVTNWFNNQGIRHAVSNAFGRVSALAFDLEDCVTNSVDANGVSLNMTYDNWGRMLTRSYPDGGVEHFGYCPKGLIAYTNQLNQTNFYVYDVARRKIAETNANGEITQFTYNAAGDLLTLVDGKSQTNKWNYDQFGRVTNKVDAANNLLFVYQYDPNSRLTSRWSIAKGSTVYQYDSVGSLTNVDYPVSPDLTLKYDALNRLTNMVDAVGTTIYSYDAAGQVLSENAPWSSDTVNFTYQNRLRTGLSVQAANASAWTQSYAYDDMRRLTNVTSPAGNFAYDYVGQSVSAGSLVHKLTLPNGAYITNYYDGNARLLGTYLRNSSDENLNTHDYVYNPGNQRTQQVFTAGNHTDYSYDKIGQLTSAYGVEANAALRYNERFVYAYDAAGNLKQRTYPSGNSNPLTEAFQVNSMNELVRVTNSGSLTVAGTTTSQATNVTVNTSNALLYADATFASTGHPWVSGNNTYTAIAKDSYGRKDTNSFTVNLLATNAYFYDLNGNMITNGTRVLDYDDENQLIRITEPSKWKSEFAYDGKMRRRIRKEYTWSGSWVLTNEVRYVYDGNLVVQERDANNLPQVTYTRGTDLSHSMQGAGGIGGLLARTENGQLIGGSPTATAFYHADGNGNVTALIYTNQLIAAKYEYDPYGNILSQSGLLADANLYRFSSKECHPNSGLVYYLYRYYESTLQRWVNRDPIQERGGINPFKFIGNRPIRAIDAFGLSFSEPHPPADPSPACQTVDQLINNTSAAIIAAEAAGDYVTATEQMNMLMQLGALYNALGCDNNPPRPPTPRWCPNTQSRRFPDPPYPSSNRSFCSAHPWVCATIGGGILTAGICILQPELCLPAAILILK